MLQPRWAARVCHVLSGGEDGAGSCGLRMFRSCNSACFGRCNRPCARRVCEQAPRAHGACGVPRHSGGLRTRRMARKRHWGKSEEGETRVVAVL
eukprot:2685308-Pleurochrysis_carterae.AAC.3